MELDGAISFENVDFTYPTMKEKQVLKRLSFEVGPGQKVALVGATGCGKSSCMSLLQRLYEPTRGTILLDDVPLAEYDVHFLRQIGANAASLSRLTMMRRAARGRGAVWRCTLAPTTPASRAAPSRARPPRPSRRCVPAPLENAAL